MTEQDSKSSSEPSSQPNVYKAIIAIGVMGDQEDVERFTALWITDCEKRAHKVAAITKVQLLPLPE